MQKLKKLVYVHYNMRLRERNLRRRADDQEQLIDLDDIFHEADPMLPWITESEDRLLDDRDTAWLDDIDDRPEPEQQRQHVTSSSSSHTSSGSGRSIPPSDPGSGTAVPETHEPVQYFPLHSEQQGAGTSSHPSEAETAAPGEYEERTRRAYYGYYPSGEYGQFDPDQPQGSLESMGVALFGYSDLYHLYPPGPVQYRTQSDDDDDGRVRDPPRSSFWW